MQLSEAEIDQRYRYWRPRLMFFMVMGYAAFYLTRKSVNFTMPVMQLELGLTKDDIGLMGTLFYLAYGSAKFGCGMLNDSRNMRWFMGVGLMMTGVLNVLFAFSHSLSALLFIWTLNGFFQGWGWPPCAKLLTRWYSRQERGFWWGCWNISISLGGAVVPLLSGWLAVQYGWQAALLVPGVIGIVLGLWLCTRLYESPAQQNLPSVGTWQRDVLELRQEAASPPAPILTIFRRAILFNPTIWLLGFSYVLVYLVRIALNDWGNIWLAESHGVGLLSANMTLSLFELGGLSGALFAGWGSDLLFRGQRAPMILLFSVGLFASMTCLWLSPVHHYGLLAVGFFSVGFFVFGPQMLIGLAATEYTHKDAAGTVTGFLGLFAYMGAALAGWPLAQVLSHYSWPGFFTLLTLATAVIGLLLMPLLMVDSAKQNFTRPVTRKGTGDMM